MAIHPLAVVDPAAEIHPDAIIGPFCVVQGKVTLGAHVELRNHATVYGRTTIGAGSVLFPGCSVGSDPQDLKFRGEDSEAIIGERVRIHECVTISKGTAGGGMKTVVGDDTLVMAYAHVGHDCLVDRGVVIANGAQVAGHVKVGRKAVIGGMVGVHHFATIGELTIVGSMSGIRFDLPPYMMADGNPAEVRGVNVIGLRRDGMGEEAIRAMRDLYRELYHDRDKSSEPMRTVVERLREELGDDSTSPMAKLIAWQIEHLDTSIKGRMQEAHRQPVVGGKPGQAAAT